MIQEKETQLKQYYKLSKSMLHALIQGRNEEFFSLLEQREVCISLINQLDDSAGSILMNKTIQELLQDQESIEQDIQKEIQRSMKKLAQQVRTVKNEKFLTKQYENTQAVAKGVFYDTKK